MSETDELDNKVKLYLGLVDQLQKYSAIFWQFPTALLAANLFGIEKYISNPFVLLGVAVLNGVLIFAYHKLVWTQRAIIVATQKAEGILRGTYADFIPIFAPSTIRSPIVVAWTLVILDSALALYALSLFCERVV